MGLAWFKRDWLRAKPLNPKPYSNDYGPTFCPELLSPSSPNPSCSSRSMQSPMEFRVFAVLGFRVLGFRALGFGV